MSGTGTPARDHGIQLVHYMRKLVNFDTAGVAAGVPLGWLPAGAHVVFVSIRINVAFNAGTTNVLTIGEDGDSGIDNVMDADDFTSEATVGNHLVAALNPGYAPPATDKLLRVAFNQTGTVATTGQAIVTLAYAPNNDG